MAKAMSGKQAVPLEEVVLAQAFEFEALLNVLERRGLMTWGEGSTKDRRKPGVFTRALDSQTGINR